MLQVNVLWMIIYFAVYCAATGIWNVILSAVIAKKSEKYLEKGFLALTSAELTYTLALERSWYVKISKHLSLLPLMNVIAMIFWPVYLPALIITALYYLKYFKPDPDRKDEDTDFEEEEGA